MSLSSCGAKVAFCVSRAEVAAAIITVVEVPCLVRLDQFSAAAAADLPGSDEWLELATPRDVRAGVAAGVPASFVSGWGHARLASALRKVGPVRSVRRCLSARMPSLVSRRHRTSFQK
jgi:hypothetical protein